MQVEMSERAAELLREYIDANYLFARCSSCNLVMHRPEVADTNGGDNVICQACFDDPPGPTFENHECVPSRPGLEKRSAFVMDRVRQVSVSKCVACGEKFDRPDGRGEFFIWADGWRSGKSDLVNEAMSIPEPFTDGWVKKYES